jgi:mannose-6-phosphate isomerase-like protein (cupin superfamily)
MTQVSPVDVAPGVHVRTVVGTTGSFSIGDFDAGSAAVLHHHTREQADVGIAGVFDMTIGTHEEALGPGAGVIVPADVAHSIANKRGGVMTVIEFHTVRRPDLVPPRPPMTFPSSAEPVPVPAGRRLIVLPARYLLEGDTMGWSAQIQDTRQYLADFDAELTRVERAAA